MKWSKNSTMFIKGTLDQRLRDRLFYFLAVFFLSIIQDTTFAFQIRHPVVLSRVLDQCSSMTVNFHHDQSSHQRHLLFKQFKCKNNAGRTRRTELSTRMSNEGSETQAIYQVKVLRSIDEVSEEEWNQCALDSAGSDKENPFVLWAFFKALEGSKSAVREVGWAPSHVAVKYAFPSTVTPMYQTKPRSSTGTPQEL